MRFLVCSFAVVAVACGTSASATDGGGGGTGGLGGGSAGGTGGGSAGGVGGGTGTDGGLDAGLDAGVDAGELTAVDGGAITAQANVWTWVNFPDSMCGNGSATGIAVNPSTASTDLMIYLEGGGACWSSLTCLLAHTASNMNGYTGANFSSDNFASAPFVNRSVANNPFKDMSFVYVPYCTGDVHAGDSTQAYDPQNPTTLIHHHGSKNMDAFLRSLAPSFPTVTRVFLTGSSAGAFGAQLNYEKVKNAFPNAEIHVLADCGQMLNPSGTLLTAWVQAWNFTAIVPTACTGCLTDFTKYPDYLATTYPNSRFGLIASATDGTLTQFFALNATDFSTATNTLLTTHYDGKANAKYFLNPGSTHVLLPNTLFTWTAPAPLLPWVTAWKNGDSTWANVR